MIGLKLEGVMPKIVNLKSAKKAKARAEKRQVANTNSVKFGLSNAEKTLNSAEVQKLSDHLDGHKREE